MLFSMKIKICLFLLLISVRGWGSPLGIRGIWNSDHRKDIYELKDKNIVGLADSTLAMIPRSDFLDFGFKQMIEPRRLGNDLKLCSGERFRDQTDYASCSATLVSDDLILTAGHCLTEEECQNNEFAFVFGYELSSAKDHVAEFQTSEVYSCKQILKQVDTEALDYSIIQLDRPVKNHNPVKIALKNAAVGQSVYILGYPSGLPLKYSGPAKIRFQSKEYFSARLDGFAGNSGSGVFSSESNELVGIFVRGDDDYDLDKVHNCQRVHKCSEPDCTGEEVTNIEAIFDP
jgi:V8-like Glu-specific endopeptidase